ncbi:hypothetical protein [Brachybacterium sp. GPGPB12]|uniref:hypothetical protein n=1 Tax=Brachybacterium sp. GPGPB12 TaxID=3023517 RepID=UPI0031345F61
MTGVDKYDDDFELQVVPSEPGTGAGAGVESTHSDYTDWYRRTDADGKPVGYDFETDTWADGWEPENADDDGADTDRADAVSAGSAAADPDDSAAGDADTDTRRSES